MNYTLAVDIDCPLDEVVRLMDDPENMSKWQPGLLRWEHLRGEPGEPGAQMKLYYDMNGRKMEMIETILKRNLPDAFHTAYEASGVTNIQHNRFEALDDGQTRWTSANEFKFKGLMRFMGLFMRDAFPKQTRRIMESFKAFAEAEAKQETEG